MTLSSLFRRVGVPLLAVAATVTLSASLCAPTRAATAAWVYCEGGIDPTYHWRVVMNQLQCVVSDTSTWTYDTTHFDLLGGGDSNASPSQYFGYVGPGDFYDPENLYWNNVVHQNGTYNCWAVCTGGSSGGAWYASTGGTKYVTF